MNGNTSAANSGRTLINPAKSSGLMLAITAHWPEYLMEAAELGLFMISACLVTVLLEHPGSPVRIAISSGVVRRVLIGISMGATAIAIIYSGWGRRSGAHFNPAMTLTFLRLGKISPWDAALYMVAQFLGGIAGVAVAKFVAGPLLADPAVRFAVTMPGTRGVVIAFIAEVIITFFLVTVVLNVSNNAQWKSYTGVFAGLLVATYISIEAPFSGMSMNPARTFGSAYIAGAFDSLWIYFVAPPLGMLIAAQAFVYRHGIQKVICAKLHHDNTSRCIFRCGYMAEEQLLPNIRSSSNSARA
jgi:aquaporin Z